MAAGHRRGAASSSFVCQVDVSLWSTKMSKTDTMAKLPGLLQRAGIWTLRVMIPLDLQGV